MSLVQPPRTHPKAMIISPAEADVLLGRHSGKEEGFKAFRRAPKHKATCTENGMSVAFELPLSPGNVTNGQNIDVLHRDLDSIVLAAVRVVSQQVLFHLHGRMCRGR